MAHYDEMTCLAYLDGQLDDLRAGELELHLRSCTPCRSLLSALEREAGLLHAAITEEDESVPAHLLSPPQPDRVPWGWFLGLGAASLGLRSLFLIIQQVWEQLQTAGFSGITPMAMIVFNGAFWKGWSDLMTTITYLSIVTLAFPLMWLLRRQMKRLKPVAMVLAGLSGILALPSPALATRIEKGRTAYTLEKGETLQEDLIVASGAMRIEGTVEGDVFAFGESLVVTGRITGDLIVFARRVRIEGQVDGNVRAFANSADVEGQVAKSATIFAETFDLSDRGAIGSSLMLLAGNADLSGKVSRDLLALMAKGRLNGFIGRDATIKGERISIRSTAEIGGKTRVTGERQPEVEAGAKLASPLEFEPDRDQSPEYTKGRFYWRQSLKYGAAFFLGLILLLMMPGFYRETLFQSKKYGPALGVGLLSLVATPIIAIIACLTIVGIPLAITGLMAYVFALYTAQIFVGSWLGNRILGQTSDTAGQIGRLALGLFLVRVVVTLPRIDDFATFVVLIWGMGAFTLAFVRSLSRGTAAETATPAMPSATA